MSKPCICIHLRKAARKTSAIYDEALAPLGISVAQFSLLRKISRAGTVSLTELARSAELDRSTMGRNAKVLQKMNLIEPAPGKDHREASLTLSNEGHNIVRLGEPLWDQAQIEIEKRLGHEGMQQLQMLLDAL
ncbi:MarR family winged helix-turn-helix transcriptional regulator [Brucella gallinifaecis]|uniref:MarR family transcriptional regulator n=1 Tax=Brucella gallinifaecis TaxID=215590 RepID=A0A502BQN5_9HYPH|nr:MarR family transcriptional regulator [Brucella gallinifaecis]TPF76514.1 MarR family transcriptional regulator [Brucella gallinifaecis]